MSVAALTALLEQCHGLRFDAQATERLRRVLATQEPGGARTVDARAAQLLTDPALLDGLLDRVTLQESSFFRDPEVFDDLATRLLPAAAASAAPGPLLAWSVGCANGQEPYSLAILLREQGVEDFTVVASDLSAAACARARAGVYTERELRGLSVARRERFLERTPEGLRMVPELRARVRVLHHNAANEGPAVAPGRCALVLCQHVLMYLTADAVERLLARIAAALGPDGRLVVALAEALWPPSERFVREPHPHAVAYRVQAHPGPPQGLPPVGAPKPEEADPPGRQTAPTTRFADTGEVPGPGGSSDGPRDGRSGGSGW